MLSSYIFVTSVIISALVITTILRDVQLYSGINFTDVSEERAAFNFTAEVLRVEL